MCAVFEKMYKYLHHSLHKVFLNEVCGSGGAVADYFLLTAGKKSVHPQAHAPIHGGYAYIRNTRVNAYICTVLAIRV